ncbi:unnamed protein product [Prorocentrum cordatum]|uniref:Uncharacterized protein n=1 Tax=Prorocentrum cordatum TaxID=2364126 RepID=A0ABN9SI67_9DINO|nr:unnamed protein product [Polarella glacialis]
MRCRLTLALTPDSHRMFSPMCGGARRHGRMAPGGGAEEAGCMQHVPPIRPPEEEGGGCSSPPPVGRPALKTDAPPLGTQLWPRRTDGGAKRRAAPSNGGHQGAWPPPASGQGYTGLGPALLGLTDRGLPWTPLAAPG